ncbi:MAG: undecaprenyldiphospho-muramoylpentapeptide beta-N- acetylglucosaminyltransferase [Syntrophorhabdus sp. PtaU1.Bin153]|nr:MAG: undecaprenyldiphospho-muramoylpentapeptide beta-N- acetylglucosaminyltransferase [Syntrophorhabdus sp. PtaU1.Bin153]
MRCIALGQAWKVSGRRVVFASYCEVGQLRTRIEAEGFDFYSIPAPHPDPGDIDATARLVASCNEQSGDGIVVVLDGYHFDGNYQKKLKGEGCRLLCIDDYGHADHYYADFILNQNFSSVSGLYARCPAYTKFLLGPKHVLLRKEFLKWKSWNREIPKVARNVLVTMGGADPDNVTLKVLASLAEVTIPDMEVAVVVGAANPHKDSIEKALDVAPFTFRFLASVDNMPELLSWADVAISAGGSTCWELAYMGVPAITLILAENQWIVGEKLDRMGASVNLGRHNAVGGNKIAETLLSLMQDQKVRRNMSIKGRKLIDGTGGSKVVESLCNDCITVRRVCEEDCKLVWQWANDRETRAFSFSSEPISWEDHVKWFAASTRNPSHFFYIVLNIHGEPIGQVRYSLRGNEAVISASIDAKFRGRGYGSQSIRSTVREVFERSEASVIKAYIKAENTRSVRSFAKAGFREDHGDLERREHRDAHRYVLYRGDII